MTFGEKKRGNRRINKKANITLFVILGLLILVISFSVIFIRNAVTSKTQSSRLSDQAIDITRTNVIKYVEDCIYNSFQDGIIELGKNGGYILKNDISGSHIAKLKYFKSDGSSIDRFNITYSLLKGGQDPPIYPQLLRPIQKLDWTRDFLISSAVSADGINIIRSTNNMTLDLRKYVLYSTKKCVNFTRFKNAGFEIKNLSNLELNNINIDTTNDGIILKVNWQLDIISPSKDHYILKEFNKNEKVRLLRIRRAIDLFLDKERTNFMNIINNTRIDDDGVIKSTGHILVSNELNKGIGLKKFDNVLVFTDEFSKIRNKPFVFYTAIENRYPALQYIGLGDKDINYKGNNYSFIVSKDLPLSNPIFFNLSAKDPDDDYLIDNNLKLKFKYGCCDDNCKTSGLIADLSDNNINDPFDIDSDEQRVYCVRINVSDEGNLTDYQDVKILVITKPLFSKSVLRMCSNGDNYINKQAVLYELSFELQPGSFRTSFTDVKFSISCNGQPPIQIIKPMEDIIKLESSNPDFRNIIDGCSGPLNIEVESTSSETFIPSATSSFDYVVVDNADCTPFS